tara:strand:+ start:365 stop:484 length:120 start_codon:yes stop_codon:yes gene_type:complete
MVDIELEKTNGKSARIDLDPKEWIIIGVVVVLIMLIIHN